MTVKLPIRPPCLNVQINRRAAVLIAIAEEVTIIHKNHAAFTHQPFKFMFFPGTVTSSSIDALPRPEHSDTQFIEISTKVTTPTSDGRILFTDLVNGFKNNKDPLRIEGVKSNDPALGEVIR
ncbi:MAG: hypothetical protein ABW101_14945 [Candidatus Thiodiazotropha sp.]